MSEISITISADSVVITSVVQKISVDIEGADLGELISEIGEDKILRLIGRDAVIEYFNIEEQK